MIKIFNKIKFIILKQFFIYINKKHNNYDVTYNKFNQFYDRERDIFREMDTKRIMFEFEDKDNWYTISFEHYRDINFFICVKATYSKSNEGEKPLIEDLKINDFIKILKTKGESVYVRKYGVRK